MKLRRLASELTAQKIISDQFDGLMMTVRRPESLRRVISNNSPHMKKNPLNKGVLTENGVGIGVVSRRMIRARAAEDALINGRHPQDATKADVDEARQELAGGPDLRPKDIILESAPESERWDPVPGSAGHQAPESSSEDENEEGESEETQLVEEGVKEATHDQMLQAARAAEKKANRE